MLQLKYLRQHKETVLKALEKRNFKGAELINQLLELDEVRRKTQTELDQQLAEANSLAKEIGLLFKNGEAQKAQGLKERSASLKSSSKGLQELLQETEIQLRALRLQIPNTPKDIVPAGATEEDNIETERGGTIPDLSPDALPHWELAKKYNLIDFELGSKITSAGFLYILVKVLAYNVR